MDNAFERFKEAHRDYVGEILDENAIIEGQLYLEDKERKVRIYRQRIADLIDNIEHELLLNTVQFRNGHYQISLPFKDRQAPVPSNKAQA